MSVWTDLDSVIGNYASPGFTDTTPLVAAGLDSLTMLRVVAAVAADDDTEIDASRLVDLRTVADLKDWLRAVAGTGRPESAC
ncbi:MAG TPA: phosphopantetheine-binding protein [Jatrophihabitans sp.]|nr:phosphopantetheine-binding protein [Jatrophihabitans sp.]